MSRAKCATTWKPENWKELFEDAPYQGMHIIDPATGKAVQVRYRRPPPLSDVDVFRLLCASELRRLANELDGEDE